MKKKNILITIICLVLFIVGLYSIYLYFNHQARSYRDIDEVWYLFSLDLKTNEISQLDDLSFKRERLIDEDKATITFNDITCNIERFNLKGTRDCNINGLSYKFLFNETLDYVAIEELDGNSPTNIYLGIKKDYKAFNKTDEEIKSLMSSLSFLANDFINN